MEKVSERLYKKVLPIWESYLEHPFVKSLAEGTLDIEKFRFYMIQDHLYLMEYAKTFAMGVIKAQNEKDMRDFTYMLVGTIDSENEVHQSYLRKLGITREQLDSTPRCLVNEAYTDYMLAEAEKGNVPEILTAVIACSWSYKLIGDYMENMESARNHEFYSHWVETYISDSFRGCNDLMIEMLDRTAKDYNEEQLLNLEKIIINCSRFEYEFWNMSWNMKDSFI